MILTTKKALEHVRKNDASVRHTDASILQNHEIRADVLVQPLHLFLIGTVRTISFDERTRDMRRFEILERDDLRCYHSA